MAAERAKISSFRSIGKKRHAKSVNLCQSAINLLKSVSFREIFQNGFDIYFNASENYKEARKCLRCAEVNGCQLIELYRTNLRVAVAELCPNMQEFTCPADVLTS